MMRKRNMITLILIIAAMNFEQVDISLRSCTEQDPDVLLASRNNTVLKEWKNKPQRLKKEGLLFIHVSYPSPPPSLLSRFLSLFLLLCLFFFLLFSFALLYFFFFFTFFLSSLCEFKTRRKASQAVRYSLCTWNRNVNLLPEVRGW